MRLRAVLPREVLGLLVEGSMRGNEERKFFLNKRTETRAKVRGALVRNYHTSASAVGPIFFITDGPSSRGNRGTSRM